MFRHTPGVDLNEFPALGTPPNSNRSNPATTGAIPAGRLASYASTAGTNANTNHLQEALIGNGMVLNEYGMQNPSSMPYQTPNGFPLPTEQLGRGMGPRPFSVDEFPALRNPDTTFGNAMTNESGQMNSKPEPWRDYTGQREGNKQYGKNGAMETAQWLQGRQDTSLPQLVPGSRKTLEGREAGKDSENAPSWSEQGEADPYGLLGLLGVIRMTDPDRSMLALGSDLTTLGLDLNTADTIYSTFVSPWSDTQTPPGLNVEPGYYLPSCYRNVKATPDAHQRMRTFSEDVLFYVFYSMPNDIAHEAAAQELYNRNWRYHKELGLWVTKEADENGRPVSLFRRTSANAIERGVYSFFDPAVWQRVKRDWTLSWDVLEERPPQSQAQPPQQQQPTATANRGVMI
ncbi:hypothetical protein BDF14DRAFT_1778573 [Spinellus fusiger]|nr:hypothetical protein BDF14DRAFT_1778573 [Spinellus fusiger]